MTLVGTEMKKSIKKCKGKPWESMVSSKNKHLAVPEALDLLDRLCAYDPQERPTAAEVNCDGWLGLLALTTRAEGYAASLL